MAGGCATLDEAPDPLVGTWDHLIENLPQGNPNGSFSITKEEGVYSGLLHGDNGDFELNDIEVGGNELTNSYFITQGYTVYMTGIFEDDGFTGKIETEGNEFRMTAVRKVE